MECAMSGDVVKPDRPEAYEIDRTRVDPGATKNEGEIQVEKNECL